VRGAKTADATMSLVTPLSVRDAVLTPSLQPTKWLPVIGTATTAEPVPPYVTVWLVAPLMTPPVSAAYARWYAFSANAAV
jgi:hypothetical protein